MSNVGWPAVEDPSRAAGITLERALTGLGVLIFGALVWRFSFLIDDAFISFRYADHWADGAGLCFNVGEAPVEGFSNFLWVVLLRVSIELGLSPEFASRALSALAAFCLLYVFHRWLAKHAREEVRAPALFLCATHLPLALWASGGLETAAFSLALFLTFGAAMQEKLRPWPLALASIALALLRVEGLLWVIVIHALGGLVRRRLPGCEARAGKLSRERLQAFAIILIACAAFLIWRWNTFGALVSNTTTAKAGMTGATLARGVRSLASYGAVTVVPIIALYGCLAALKQRGKNPACAAAGAMALAGMGFQVAVGGDWMPMFRFMAPFAPFIALSAAVAVMNIAHRAAGPTHSRAGLVAVLALGLLQLGPAFDWHIAPRALREAVYFRGFRRGYETELQRWKQARKNTHEAELLGRALAQIGGPGDRLVTGAIGGVGYYSGVGILDRNGLVDAGVADFPLRPEVGTAGHDRRAPRSAFLDREPRWLRVALTSGPRDPEAPFWHAVFHKLGRRVTREDPLDAKLLEHCVGRVYILEREEGFPQGPALIALEYTPDPEEARAFWRALGPP